MTYKWLNKNDIIYCTARYRVEMVGKYGGSIDAKANR